MLNFRKANVLLIVVILILLMLDLAIKISFLFYFLPVLAWSALVFYGCYRVDSGFFIEIKCKGDSSAKLMALTFDDGPSAQITPGILDILNEQQVKATFFCIGRNIEGNEALIKRMHAEGHTIGNHSDSHAFWFDMFPVSKMMADLSQFDWKIKNVLGMRTRMFRPPYGVTNPTVKKVILQGNYFPIGWSIRSMDTVIKDKNKLLEKVKSRFAPGAVLLFHDTCEVTKEILKELITNAKQQGYQWVTVDQLFRIQPYV